MNSTPGRTTTTTTTTPSRGRSTSNTPSPAPNTFSSTTTSTTTPAHRRVLQAAGRPLRRVSRALLVVNNNDKRHPTATTTTAASKQRRRRRRRSNYGAVGVNDGPDDPIATQQQQQQHRRRVSHSGTTSAIGRSSESRDDDDDEASSSCSSVGAPTTKEENNDAVQGGVVRGVERGLRQTLFVVSAYLLGNSQPHRLWVTHLAEYTLVAWLLCLVVLLYYVTIQQQQQQQQQNHEDELEEEDALQDELNLEEGDIGEQTRLLVDTTTTSSILEQGDDDHMEPRGRMLFEQDYNDDNSDGLLLPEQLGSSDTVESPKKKPLTFPHPSLESLFLVLPGDRRMVPNSGQTYRLDNEWFDGVMMIMVRTPDVNEPQSAASYFVGKQRRFEFHYQLKVKKVPQGRPYFAAELQEPIKMGMIQRAIVGAAMAFMKKMNPTFHFSLTKSNNGENGDYELPHVAFTVEGSMDRMVATKPGEALPVLGEPIFEDAESIKRRKKGGATQWNTRDTYTFALWTAYVDLLDWKCLNLPGIRPFSLARVLGDQHMNLTLYAMPDGVDTHGKLGRTEMVNLEVSNGKHSSLGPLAREWVKKNAVQLNEEEMDEERPDIPLSESTDDEEDEEAEEVDALGESIYLRSGDNVILQEVVPDDDRGVFFVCSGGGFAVLQDRAMSTIVIEKVQSGVLGRSHPSASTRARSRLIKSGDKVLVKLLTRSNQGDETEIRYLSIHRGWWLKWVSTAPTKNGFFRIYTHESEFDPRSGRDMSQETQSSYLTLGGAFWLRHQRWSKYQVGVGSQESATYGGRMLGLYRPQSFGMGGEARQSDDENERDIDDSDDGRRRSRQWMQPIQLKAQLAAPVVPNIGSVDIAEPLSTGDPELRSLLAGHYDVDVPVWIEMMNRTARRRQLLYVVRVSGETASTGEPSIELRADDEVERSEMLSFSRLRTGDELASLIRLGQTHRRETIPQRKSDPFTSGYASDGALARTPTGLPKPDGGHRARTTSSSSFDGDDGTAIINRQGHHALWDDIPVSYSSPPDFPRSGKRGKKIIGQIAKSVKTGTSKTGKQVVKQSKKVGKGTVSAGKKIMTPIAKTNVRPRRPPSKEPTTRRIRTSSKGNRRRSGRDHYVVVNREMRRMEEEVSQRRSLHPPKFLAGQLCASDQSCRTASHMLSQIRNETASSASARQFSSDLCTHISPLNEFDSSFLLGGSSQVGVLPEDSSQSLVYESLVARCLWESHWREEWCGIYESGIVFYAPLTKKPSLKLSFADIEIARPNELDVLSPLPGFAILTIESAWQCHYIAFSGEEARGTFIEKLDDAMESCSRRPEELEDEDSVREKALWKARFWQGFQNSVESSLSGGQGKWAKVSSSSKMLHRTILNCRKMVFDCEALSNEQGENISTGSLSSFVERLLSMSLSFSEDSLREDPQKFVDFLNATSRLRHVALGDIDLSSSEALCLFVDLYHCLLQHALLVTVKGPLTKRSCSHFMRSTSYEIGGDVFSLAELHCCIIRGNLSKAVSPKPPYVEAPRKSNAYRFYALEQADARINFVLNTGDVSCPQSVPILIPTDLNQQLNAAATTVIRTQLQASDRRLIVLPKLCEVYRNDFGGGSDRDIVSFCMRYLDAEAQRSIQSSLFASSDEAETVIKFQHTAQQYHVVLRLDRTIAMTDEDDDDLDHHRSETTISNTRQGNDE